MSGLPPSKPSLSDLFLVLQQASLVGVEEWMGAMPYQWEAPVTPSELMWMAVLLVGRGALVIEELEALCRLGGARALDLPVRRAARSLDLSERSLFDEKLRKGLFNYGEVGVRWASWLWLTPLDDEGGSLVKGEGGQDP